MEKMQALRITRVKIGDLEAISIAINHTTILELSVLDIQTLMDKLKELFETNQQKSFIEYMISEKQ
jgi:hypothetical protein